MSLGIAAATPDRPWLVADIGGTNARFALVDDEKGMPRDVAVLSCADHVDLAAAGRAYLEEHRARPSAACVAVAGPVSGDRFRLTNHSWDFSVEETRRSLELDRLALVNDFMALALSLPRLAPADLIQIGGGTAMADQALAVVGPGTGLGVGGLLPVDGRWVPIPGEGGHVDAPAVEDREMAVVRLLRQEQGTVSAECLLSGGGLERLHRTLARVDGTPAEPLPASLITERALADGDALCRETLSMFCALLGSLAGNVAVTLGARGGVMVGGGIAPRFPDFLAASAFRARFEGKTRMADYARAIPTHLIIAKTPALSGAAAWLADKMEQRA